MNTELYNELLEAKSQDRLQEVFIEKIAELNIETQDEFDAFCDICNEKQASIGAAGIIGGAALAAIPAMLIGNRMVNQHKKDRNWTRILQDKPSLKNNEKRTKSHYEMLWKMAPTLMDNPTLAASMLEQLAQYDMIDHQMVNKIIDAERSLQQARQGGGVMSTIKTVGDAAGSMAKLIDLGNKGMGGK